MHLLAMVGFALCVSVVFAGINSETETLQARFLYGLKVFGSFIGTGIGIALVLYLFQR